ncbi:MAG TPA: hypothetical protein PKL14_01880 [Holophaga sp.]|nr:hypothetical protein [Holophaga sp.]
MLTLILALATLAAPTLDATDASSGALSSATATPDRRDALLEKIRRLSPEGRTQVIAQMEIALAQASPASRPALEDLLKQVKAVAAEDKAPQAKATPSTEATPNHQDVRTSLTRFRQLSPDKRRKVLARMEAEATKASPEAKAGYLQLISRLRALDTQPSSPKASDDRLRSSVANYRKLDADGRAKVLAQLEADAEKATPRLKGTLQALILRLQSIPAATKP